jgi:phage terminase small subunit
MLNNGEVKEQIRKDYETGKYTFKQLSEKYKVSQGTIKSWSKRDKDEGNQWIKVATKQKTKGKKVATKTEINKVANKEVAEEINEVLENDNLTDKQKLFCIYYPRCFNATKAAIKAGYSKDTAYQIGYQLLHKTSIRTEIQKIKQNKMNRAMLSPDDIFQKYMDIAFSAMTDYSSFGSKTIVMRDKKTGKPILNDKGKEITFKINYVDLNESSEVDGSLISEIKEGKDGVSIKLHDSMKALEWLTKHMDMATEEQKLRMDKMRADIEKAKNENLDDDIEYSVEGEIDEDQEED